MTCPILWVPFGGLYEANADGEIHYKGAEVMVLFEVPKRINRAQDTAIVKKSKSISKKAVQTVKGDGLLGRIAEIKAQVESKFEQFKDDYIVISEETVLDNYIKKCVKNKVISIDTETTGLDPLNDTLVGTCIYTPGMKAAYIPLNHISYVTGVRVNNQLSMEFVLNQFKRIEQGVVDVIMFNANFDIRVLRNQLKWKQAYCTWDCYLAAKCLNENEEASGLKPLHKKYILKGQGDAFSFDSLFKGVPFNQVPVSAGYLYAARDALMTYELYEFQKHYLHPDFIDDDRKDLLDVSWLFHNIEMPCVNVVADMEDLGIAFDLGYQQVLSEKYNDLLKKKIDHFYHVCDNFSDKIATYRSQVKDNKLSDPISISSPVQLAILLYDILKLESVDKKAPRGTGEPVLQKITQNSKVKDKNIIELCKAILDYRETFKLVTTYIDKLPDCVDKKDKRVHCVFNQYGARTGRMSSENPNLQNIPSHNKDIRKMFVASDGYVLLSSDYSQQEPKVMTQMCGDPKMIKAYHDGKDLYAEIASLAFNTTYEDCLEFRPDGTTNKEGKNRRTQAKSILLGVLYGRGVPSIAEQLGTTTKKAQAIKDSVFKGFPAIPRFEKDSLQMARELGYVTTLWGRKRRLPDLQLEEYEFKWKDGAPPDDDLLDFDDMNDPEYNDSDVPEDTKRYYLNKLKNCWGSQKRAIFEEANKEGIWIVDNGAKISDASRQTVNSRIQGSAADMTKLALILVHNDKELKNLGFRLLVPVHDELIGECPEKNAKKCAKRFADLMSQAAASRLEIPIKCDVTITKEWYGEEIRV